MSEKLTITLDASQIHEFMSCEQKWSYGYVEHLRLAEADTEAMDKGTLVHKLLELFYIEKSNGRDIFDAAQVAVEGFVNGNYTELAGYPRAIETFIIKRFSDYILRYSNSDFVPLKINNVSSVELGFSKILYESEYVLYIVEGKIDLIEERDGLKVWWDHKTQDRFNNLYQYKPQFLTYAWATGYEWGGVNYFGVQKEVGVNTFRRNLTHYPKWMIKRWEQSMLKVFHSVAAIRLFSDANESLAINEKWTGLIECSPKRNLNSCAGSFESHPCYYAQLCETETEEMREQIKNFKYKKVEPWQPWSLKEKV